MNSFGSNATAMGGSAGRVDAMIGAVEAQMAEGCLHLHFFMFLQNAFQFKTLEEIAQSLRSRLLTGQAWKDFVSHVRCGAYPNLKKFDAERDEIEKAWPAFANDFSLSRLDADLWATSPGNKVIFHPWGKIQCPKEEWLREGGEWLHRYHRRLQHTMSRMNHHIHPLNKETGLRYVLNSCKPKDKLKSDICKHGYPLSEYLTEKPLLVCDCIAKARGLTARGARGMLGEVLVRRNCDSLNAGPGVWVAFYGANGDIKFTQKLPILMETHEDVGTDEEKKECCESRHFIDMLFDLQARQAAQAGYCGGYQTKVQPIGDKELTKFHQAFIRTVDSKAKQEKNASVIQKYNEYSKRFFKDMESKGTLRTVVESMNLAEYADHPDPLMAECPRSFPSVTFAAGLFLKRSEIETEAMETNTINRPMRHSHGNRGRAHLNEPVDIMYGYSANFN